MLTQQSVTTETVDQPRRSPSGQSRSRTEGYADTLYTQRWRVIALSAAMFVVGGLWASGIFSDLVIGGFTVVDSDSAKAVDLEEATLGRLDADAFVVMSSGNMAVDSPEFREAARDVLSGFSTDQVEEVIDFWSTGIPELVSADGQVTYAGIQLEGRTDPEKLDSYLTIKDDLTSDVLDVTVGGPVPLFDDVNEESKKDATRAEMIALPILLLLLFVIFRSPMAAVLTVGVGVLAIVGALAALRLIAQVMEISVFAVNVISLLGLGMAIDYSLFVVNRFREELTLQGDVPSALTVTMMTAGRTIAISAITVVLSLSSLLVFPHVVIRSISLGGIAAVTLSLIFSWTFMPACLAALGDRVMPRSVPGLSSQSTGKDRWARIARAVMKRPFAVAGAIVVLLLALGLPFLRLSLGWIDTRVLPEDTTSRQAQEILDENFGANITNPMFAIVTLADTDPNALEDYRSRLLDVDGVDGAVVTGFEGRTARINLGYNVEPISAEGRELINEIRAIRPPDGGEVLIGGNTAVFADLVDMITGQLPWMALVVVVSTFLLLFFSFGSFVVPIKALFLNALSLTAAFGAVVWIFQEGNLSGLLDFTPTGNIDVVQLILILAIAFGLSMDYEVFLLSRIREHFDQTGDNAAAVASGLQSTGSIITNAALLLIVVIGAFATSGVLVVKIIGVGLAIAIFVDATIVRVLLAPATMQMLSERNWWAPGWAQSLYTRWGISESEGVSTVPVGLAPAAATPSPTAVSFVDSSSTVSTRTVSARTVSGRTVSGQTAEEWAVRYQRLTDCHNREVAGLCAELDLLNAELAKARGLLSTPLDRRRATTHKTEPRRDDADATRRAPYPPVNGLTVDFPLGDSAPAPVRLSEQTVDFEAEEAVPINLTLGEQTLELVALEATGMRLQLSDQTIEVIAHQTTPIRLTTMGHTLDVIARKSVPIELRPSAGVIEVVARASTPLHLEISAAEISVGINGNPR